ALALLHPHCVVAAPAQEAASLCCRQPPCQGVPTPTTGVAAPAGGRDGRGLAAAGWLQLAVPAGGRPLQGAWPQATAPCR
ncbi:hypothetical protein BHM03_00026786, partial [Ensete ventricosum]